MSRKRNRSKPFVDIFKDRHFYLVLLVLLIFTVFTARLFILQIVEGEKHEDEEKISNMVTLETDSPRGDIYDRNGVLIATVRTVYTVNMTYVSSDQASRDRMYLELIELLDEMGEEHMNSLSPYLKSPEEWSGNLSENESARDNFINDIAIKKSDREKLKDPKDAFRYLRKDIFKISDEYTDEEAYKIMEIRYETYKYGLSVITPMKIAEEVSSETMAIIEARHLDFPGVTTEAVYKREYVNPEYVGNIIGYVRAISSEEYDEMKDLGYSFTDIIGKTGIEKAAESYLRGIKGSRTVYFDPQTQTIKEYASTEPVPGNDIYLTIDLNLQRTAYEALATAIKKIASQQDNEKNFGDANAGAIIVEDVKTGEILAMASYPTYDISLFLEPSNNTEAQKAITDLFQRKDAPTLNRATQGLYAIGSTFKPVVASAALETGTITLETKYLCEGSIVIANRIHKCLGSHGEIDVVKAIRRSCNVFFQRAAIEVGITTLDSWSLKYGFGEKTGIEIAEYAGNRSNEEVMKQKEPDMSHQWSDSDTAQTAIGQLYTLFTPIQLSNYVSALANGGYLNTPHLIDSVISREGNTVYVSNATSNQIGVSQETLDIIRQGMCEMINNNDVAQTEFVSFPLDFVAGKTGTPETGSEAYGESSNSVFICYAPADDPQIAISVVIEHGVWGTNSIAPAARVMEMYFSQEISGKNTNARKEGLFPGFEFRNLAEAWERLKEESKPQGQD